MYHMTDENLRKLVDETAKEVEDERICKCTTQQSFVGLSVDMASEIVYRVLVRLRQEEQQTTIK